MQQSSHHADTAGVTIQVSRDIVVAFVQVDLDENVVQRFQTDLLRRIQEAEPLGAIIDLSGLETIDSGEFAALRRVVTAAAIMGTETVLVGLRPGVVSALIESGAHVEGLRAAVSLDAAFALFEPQPELPAEDDQALEPAADANTEPHDESLLNRERPAGDTV